MQSQLPFYPEQASNFAPQVDALMLFITAICLFFAVAITAAIVIFFFKFHRKQPNAVGIAIHGDSRLEDAWMIIPFILAMAMFGWGAVVYVDYRHTPPDTLDSYVIGKQWMWEAPRSLAKGLLRGASFFGGWFHRGRGRSLTPRIDFATECKNCSRVSAADAHVPGTADRGADSRSYRLYQVSAVASGSRQGCRDCSAHGEEISHERNSDSSIAGPQNASSGLSQRHLRH